MDVPYAASSLSAGNGIQALLSGGAQAENILWSLGCPSTLETIEKVQADFSFILKAG
jgi:hypothetical protein